MKLTATYVPQTGTYKFVVDVQAWEETFIVFPRRTISGKLIYMEKAYTRRVWSVFGDARFHMESERQYATIFDVIAEDLPHEPI